MLQHGLDPMGEDDDGNSSHSSSHSSIQSSHSTNSKASHKVDPPVPLSTSSSSSISILFYFTFFCLLLTCHYNATVERQRQCGLGGLSGEIEEGQGAN
jgi:hypothetical protein